MFGEGGGGGAILLGTLLYDFCDERIRIQEESLDLEKKNSKDPDPVLQQIKI